MENQSRFDPTRKTIGAMYNDLHSGKEHAPVLVGDMTKELMKSLVEDLNKCIESKPYGDRPFYIMIHEKKDAQMKTNILRRLITWKFRPYPEDDTVVFYVNPMESDVRFCWCLPHWSEMPNILNNPELFDTKYINEIKAWRRNDLSPFGFVKDEMGNWRPHPNWKDQPLKKAA